MHLVFVVMPVVSFYFVLFNFTPWRPVGENIVYMKPVCGAKKVWDSCYKGPWSLTCLWTLQGKLEPRLIGATTATRVGEGADCRFLGGRAGGGLITEEKQQNKTTHMSKRQTQYRQSGKHAKHAPSSGMYAHTDPCMNTWTHTLSSLQWSSEMRVRGFHVSLSQIWHGAVLLSKRKVSELIRGTQGTMIWRPAETHRVSHTLSCTARNSDWMLSSSGKVRDNTTFGMMQPCKSKTSNPEA